MLLPASMTTSNVALTLSRFFRFRSIVGPLAQRQKREARLPSTPLNIESRSPFKPTDCNKGSYGSYGSYEFRDRIRGYSRSYHHQVILRRRCCATLAAA